jgi:D-glycerate 3-kinase
MPRAHRPPVVHGIATTAGKRKVPSIAEAVSQKIRELQLPADFVETVRTAHRPIADHLLAQTAGRKLPLVVAICGCQGSGKSTLAAFLKLLLDRRGKPTAILSLDDLYLTKTERGRLARDVHPLLRTRGVPGTHDIGLGAKTLARLRSATARSRTALPAFDKARDDRVPRDKWGFFQGRPSFILFEGWCVDARPQPPAALAKPVNRLERDCDPEGIWRRYVNDQLGGPYQALFAPVDLLLFMEAPSFDCVYKWRGLQEKKLRAYEKKGEGLMDGSALETFIMHYERLTRWMLEEMPARADIYLPLARDQRIRGVEIRRRSKS